MALKGDLKNVQLADLFQTLTSNNQEGVLRLRWQDQTKEIYFGRQGITLLNPQIQLRRRLGDMLVEADVIDRSVLDEALAQQTKTSQYLGAVLTEMGAITEDQLQKVLSRQIEEEIYTLFGLDSASFEFGEVPPPEGVPVSAYFRVDGIVLEAARRMDEWQVINEKIPDLNAIYIQCADNPPDDEDLARVYERLNGTRAVLDVADSLLASPFSTAKSLIQLIDSGVVRAAEPDEMVQAAQECFQIRRPERALRILKRAESVTGDSRAALLGVIARLYRQAGDGAAAARVMLRLARLVRAAGDKDGARTQLERAYRLAPEDTSILQELADVHKEGGDGVSELAYLQRLVEIHISRKDDARALRALDRMHQIDPNHEMLARCYVSVCKGAGEQAKAVSYLEELLEQNEVQAHPRRVLSIYRQIIELTPSRTDVLKKMRKLRTDQSRQLRRRVTLGLLVFASVAMAALGTLYTIDRRAGMKELARAEELLERGDISQAIAVANQVRDEHLAVRSSANELASRAIRKREQIERDRLDELKRVVGERMVIVWDKFDNGSVADALNLYIAAAKELWQPESAITFKNNAETIRQRMESERDVVVRSARAFRLPALETASIEELARVHDEFHPRFNSERKGDFLSFAQIARREAAGLPELSQNLEASAQMAQEIVAAFEPVEKDLQEITRRLFRLSDLEEMGGVYESALNAERDGDIEKATELYESLITRYGEGQLTSVFRERMEHVLSARNSLNQLEQQIAAKDFAAAYAEAYAIITRYPNLHLDKTLQVPVQLIAEPANATLRLSSGTAQPDHLRLPATGTVTITASAEGFDPEVRECRPDKDSVVRVFLHRSATLKVDLFEPVEATPATQGPFAYIGTRNGHLHAVNLDQGKVVESFDSGSFFGIRSKPVVTDKELFVTSAEGKLHILTREPLSQRLVIPLASESRAEPLVTADRIYIGTESGALQVFDRTTGKLDFQLTRKSPLRGQPALLGDRLVVAFVGGQLLCLNALTGEPLWELRNGEGFVGSLLSHEGRVLMATEAGLLAVDPDHGTPIKRVTVGQLPVCGPTLLDGDIFVVAGNRIVRFDAKTLEALTTYTARETLNGPPALGNDRVFVSGAQGSQFCFDKKSGKLLYQSPMKEAMQAAALATSRGILFVTGKGHAEVLAP